MPSEKQQKLAAAICEFLDDCVKSKDIENQEGIEVAIQIITESFGIEGQNTSIKPATLTSIFDVFLATQKKMTEKQEPKKSVAENKARAEILKADGNKKMAAREYDAAIQLYSQAIELYQDAVFFSNRAAAYSQKGDHESAVTDANKAIEIDPEYSKAYSRLGHALFGLGKFEEAASAYEQGLKLEPGNQSMIQSLAAAQQKAGGVSNRSSPLSQGIPGGSAGLSEMFKNPEFMNMGIIF